MYLPIDTLLQGGKYKIVRYISSGGFGCTYEAEHVMLQKRVAIKEFFVKDFCNRDETTAHVTVGTQSKKGLVDKLRRKFIDEARAISRMTHPNIVRVSDVFEENGTAYFVMDYIDGQSLGELLKKESSLPEKRALKYIRQIAEALQYVHKQNRLHLDVKPSNIMIDNTDNAVLIDFGASKQYDEEEGENTSTLIGKTPGYAPLEQMGNDVVTFLPATDIYALGATLYKMLTGNTPPSANLLASGDELGALPEGTSKSTTAAISAAMQINKKKRPQNIAEFLSILDIKDAVVKKKKEVEDEVTVLDVVKKTEKVSNNAITSTTEFSYAQYSDELFNRAQAGEVKAQINLANCYEHGYGVRKNLAEAIYWYSEAAKRGDAWAKDKLKKLDSNNNETVKENNGAVGQTNYYNQDKDEGSNGERLWGGLTIVGCVLAVIIMLKVEKCDSSSEYATEKIPYESVETVAVPNRVQNQKMINSEGEEYDYTGTVNDEGNADGYGEGIYKNGKYTGEYVNGCREGENATYVTFDGKNKFEGTYKDDKYARGILTFEDGSYFEGSFKDNKFDMGKFYNKDGSFDSEMKDGKYI